MIWIVAYLASVVLANVTVTLWPWMAYVNAIVFIGADLTLKDRFQIRYAWWQVFCIILAGGFITVILNTAFWPIALASSAAFLVSGIVDYIAFALVKRSVVQKIIVSNIFGSFADSLVFAILAPFPFTWGFVVIMTILKWIGGAITVAILARHGAV